MTDFPKQLDQFTAYAQKVTIQHAEELDIKFEEMTSENQEKAEAYYQHQKTLDEELTLKIEEITRVDSNVALKASLFYLKDYYINTFKTDIARKNKINSISES